MTNRTYTKILDKYAAPKFMTCSVRRHVKMCGTCNTLSTAKVLKRGARRAPKHLRVI